MNEDKLDVLMDNFLSGLNVDSSEEWIRENSKVLFNEGVGKEALLKLVLNDLGEDIYSKTELILNENKLDFIKEDAAINGIGGWLTLLCFSLLIVIPAINAFDIFKTYDSVAPLFNSYPDIKTYSYAVFLLAIVVIIFGMFCGVSLISIKPYAVKATKIFLITLLIVSLVQPLLPYVFGLPDAVQDAMLIAVKNELFTMIIQPIVYFSIWYSYLSVSVRVKETYKNET